MGLSHTQSQLITLPLNLILLKFTIEQTRIVTSIQLIFPFQQTCLLYQNNCIHKTNQKKKTQENLNVYLTLCI